jgi:hypothetical protein
MAELLINTEDVMDDGFDPIFVLLEYSDSMGELDCYELKDTKKYKFKQITYDSCMDYKADKSHRTSYTVLPERLALCDEDKDVSTELKAGK